MKSRKADEEKVRRSRPAAIPDQKSTTVELVGPGGRVVVDASQVPSYTSVGYKVVNNSSDHAPLFLRDSDDDIED